MKISKNKWIFTLTIISCLIVGGFIGEILSSYIPLFEYSYQLNILTNNGIPWLIDLKVLRITLGLAITFNLGSALLLVFGMVLFYKK